ncbi:serine/threonine-protein kinase [Streptomyces sp. NPDC059740]|uniref:serine/threonine-protein kinase n=1 Tax=Streptomyces sp. NPDC059740 TaxID=3346926 RepID=UPI00364EF1DA
MSRSRFHKIRKLGAGGQGEVLLVREESTSTIVALKRPLADANLDAGSREMARFQREARIQSKLTHPGIMPILGIYRNATGPSFTMPRAETSLEEVLKSGPISEMEATNIILVVADAIDYAHREGVLHRDLKPANILLLDKGWVVSDFGLCLDMNSNSLTITQSNTVVGSVAYMAPEQYDDAHEITASADIFSIGRIFYHMLTGKSPFPYMRLEQVPRKFRYLISKSVSESPSSRYQKMAEFRNELELLTSEAPSGTDLMEAARALNTECIEGDERAAAQLARLLIENAEDEIFYKDFVPFLPADSLAAMEVYSTREFKRIVLRFDELSEGDHPFTYTDKIANFFRNVVIVSTDFELRRAALRRILIVGASHNRFYIGGVFADLVEALGDMDDVMLIASLLRENPHEARFMASYLRQRSVSSRIVNALPD